MLKTRVITAIVLLIGFSLALFQLPPPAWAWLVAVVCGLAGWEWARLCGGAALLARGYGLLVALLAMLLSRLWLDESGHLLARAVAPAVALFAAAILFWLTLVPVWLRLRWRLRQLPLGLLLGLLLILPPAMALCLIRAESPWMLLAAMAVVWVADIAAYFSGRAFGRHKLAPNISPGKTWEGVCGAIFGVWASAASVLWWHDAARPAWAWLMYALLLFALTALSVIGDLFESLMKRQAGMKDSSGLLPGHGGVLDRIDSLTSTLPFVGLALVLGRLNGFFA